MIDRRPNGKEQMMFGNDDKAATTNVTTTDTMSGQQFAEGTPVYDAGGDKIGTVSEHNVQRGYLVVHKGWLFRQDVYVPLQVVARSDADGVYLNLYKDEVLNQDWNAPPVYDMAGTADATTIATGTAATGAAEIAREGVSVPVREEELIVGKQEQEIGRVHLHKDVVEEQQSITEPVTREQVTVERVPVTGEYGEYKDAGPDAFTEKDIDVPVMGEEVIVGKRAVVTEEIRLRKEDVTEEQQVSGTVRKERVRVEGADEVRGADTPTDADVNYRTP